MEIPVFEAVAAPLIAFTVQAFKTAGVPGKYAGLVALALGLFVGTAWGLWVTDSTTVGVGAFAGLIAGFTASGGYSQKKALEASDTPPPAPRLPDAEGEALAPDHV